MLPKLHKSPRVAEMVNLQQKEYIHVNNEVIVLEGRLINSGPCYFTRGLSLIIHEILIPVLGHIRHILKDSFEFKDKFTKSCTEETYIATWDLKSLYTNMRHDLSLKAVDYWIPIYQSHLLPPQLKKKHK